MTMPGSYGRRVRAFDDIRWGAAAALNFDPTLASFAQGQQFDQLVNVGLAPPRLWGLLLVFVPLGDIWNGGTISHPGPDPATYQLLWNVVLGVGSASESVPIVRTYVAPFAADLFFVPSPLPVRDLAVNGRIVTSAGVPVAGQHSARVAAYAAPYNLEGLGGQYGGSAG